MTSLLGVLRTMPQQAQDEPRRFGDQSPRAWDVIPGLKLRNDGVYPAVLVPGYAYELTHDGVGWLLTPQGKRPHAYLVGPGLEPVTTLELAHRAVMLDSRCRYAIERNETGAWCLVEHVAAVI